MAPDKHGNNVVVLPRSARACTSKSDPAMVQIIDAIQYGIRTAEEDFEAVDRDLVRDEQAFYARFRIDWPPFYREQLLQLKRTYGLTDRQIRHLLALGYIKKCPQGVQWKASRWDAWYGRSMMTLFGVLIAMVCLLFISHAGHLSAAQILRGLCATAGYCTMVWVVDRVYVRPWRIWLRVRHLQPA